LKVEDRKKKGREGMMESGGRGGIEGYDGMMMTMTRDPKPRLRWTTDLHDRFVDAVTKLGGPDSMYLFFHPVLLKFLNCSRSFVAVART